MTQKSKQTTPESDQSDNAPKTGVRATPMYGAARTHREAPPATNIPVARYVVDPEIPWVDQRRFRQVMRVDRDDPIEPEAVLISAPIYPFTSGIQLTNDGVGFGEEIIESRVPSGPDDPPIAPSKPLHFRRTRSGKVPCKGPGTSISGPSGRGST